MDLVYRYITPYYDKMIYDDCKWQQIEATGSNIELFFIALSSSVLYLPNVHNDA